MGKPSRWELRRAPAAGPFLQDPTASVSFTKSGNITSSSSEVLDGFSGEEIKKLLRLNQARPGISRAGGNHSACLRERLVMIVDLGDQCVVLLTHLGFLPFSGRTLTLAHARVSSLGSGAALI